MNQLSDTGKERQGIQVILFFYHTLELQAAIPCSQFGEDVEVQLCVGLGAGYSGYFLSP